jgi:hypothetical protein
VTVRTDYYDCLSLHRPIHAQHGTDTFRVTKTDSGAEQKQREVQHDHAAVRGLTRRAVAEVPGRPGEKAHGGAGEQRVEVRPFPITTHRLPVCAYQTLTTSRVSNHRHMKSSVNYDMITGEPVRVRRAFGVSQIRRHCLMALFVCTTCDVLRSRQYAVTLTSTGNWHEYITNALFGAITTRLFAHTRNEVHPYSSFATDFFVLRSSFPFRRVKYRSPRCPRIPAPPPKKRTRGRT